MSLVDLLTDNQAGQSVAGAVYGVVVGLVSSIDDPDDLGRVKVQYPWLQDDSESPWARVLSFMGGANRGALFRPEVDDEVLVMFEHGDMRFPYVIGGLWNGQQPPPEEKGSDADNNIRLIKSRSGHLIILDDTDGGEKIEIIDNTGDNSITIDAANNAITITSAADITFSAASGTITLECQDLAIAASSGATIEAASGLEVKSDATLTIKGSTVNIN